jgi:hypothetical protein
MSTPNTAEWIAWSALRRSSTGTVGVAAQPRVQ